jgi:hypothetical protein
MRARFVVKTSFQIAGRGPFLVGDVEEGHYFSIGMVESQTGLQVKSVEFVDHPDRTVEIAVGFESSPSKEELDRMFPSGSVIEIVTRGNA